MKFGDASAIVPLVLTEPTTKAVQTLAEKDPAIIVWWATEVECASAIARLELDDALDDAAATRAFQRLRQLAQTWHEIDASDPIREAAVRFLRVHPLATRMRCSSPLPSSPAERRPSSLEMVTLDDRLAAAARKDGFTLIEVPSGE
jgi:uncharacterized protein